ncbi:MAG TPA: DUF998 domain-containing protein [Actinoplanes sp.]|nr:DUF998 domain-containing protein [Actinoplanes sp.]
MTLQRARGTAGTRTGGVGRWYRGVFLSLAVATAAGTSLLVVGDVDPMDEMLSDSVQTVPGDVLLAVAASALASAGAWLLAGARRILPRASASGGRGTGPLAAMLSVWCGALLVVAAFPTNAPGTEPDLAAMVHRGGAGLVVALPPLITLRIAGTVRTGGAVLRVAGWSTLGGCGLFGMVNGPAMVFGEALPAYAGLLERILLGLVLLSIGLCGWVLRSPREAGDRTAITGLDAEPVRPPGGTG